MSTHSQVLTGPRFTPAQRRLSTHGTLPRWAPLGVPAAFVALAAAVIAGTDVAPGVALAAAALLSGVAVWAWSRAVEGSRAATDRAVTHTVTAAFLLAVTPLVSLLVTVIGKNRVAV